MLTNFLQHGNETFIVGVRADEVPNRGVTRVKADGSPIESNAG